LEVLVSALPDLSQADPETVRRCLGDVVALSTLPAVWAGAPPLRIAESLASALSGMLDAAFVCVDLRDPGNGSVACVAQAGAIRTDDAFARDLATVARPGDPFDYAGPDGTIVRVVCRALGEQGASGVIAVGFAGGPSALDHLLLDVSATQAATGLSNALLVHSVRQGEARFRTALEIGTVGAILFRPDGRLVDANAAFLSMSGHARADLDAGRLTLQTLTAPEWRETVAASLAELEAKGETTPLEKEYLRPDGTRWWGLFASKRLPDGLGFKFVVDITEQKQAVLALREQAVALEALNRTAAATAIEKDLDRLVKVVVDAGVELSGAEFGAFFYNVVDPAGERYMLYALSGAPEEAFAHFPMPRNTPLFAPTFSGESIVRSDDIRRDPRYGRNAPRQGMPEGHLPVASYLAAPVVSRGGEVLGALFFGHSAPARFTADHERLMVGLGAQAAIAIDNARLLQAVQAANETLEQNVAERTAALTEAHEALRQAQKMEAVGQLTGGIAHDFNNLLMGISGSLDMLERRLKRSGVAGFERYLDGAQSSARRAAALTQRLLAFSRRQTLDPRPTDVNRLIHGMEELIGRTVGPSIAVMVEGAPDLWNALIDAVQLESALLNLAINARDAMPGGGRITIATGNCTLDDRAARERDLEPGAYLSIAVTDTGSGMPSDVVERIFDPFFTTKPAGEGTGLGLSMVHGFVRQSGGQVVVETQEGAGTTMRIYIPHHAGAAVPDAVERPADAAAGAGETILVVDDEATIRMLVRDALEEAGYTVLEAEDGLSSLRVLDTEARIDLLVTDVGLPGGMDGRQVADAARQARPGLPVLFVTGFARKAAVGHGQLPEGMAVLTKPFAMADLLGKVTEMFERQREWRTAAAADIGH
jgi:PAS domain S-box-containing protein